MTNLTLYGKIKVINALVILKYIFMSLLSQGEELLKNMNRMYQIVFGVVNQTRLKDLVYIKITNMVALNC